jgi:hypothetical protein
MTHAPATTTRKDESRVTAGPRKSAHPGGNHVAPNATGVPRWLQSRADGYDAAGPMAASVAADPTQVTGRDGAEPAAGDITDVAMPSPPQGGSIRAKLEVGGVNDPEEHEADSLASAALADSGKAPCACGGTCPSCSGSDKVRRKADAEGGGRPAGMEGLGSGIGRPLDRASRAFFEPRFGTDLGAVHIHDDPSTRMQARAMGARAFAIGSDIGFAAGSPESEESRPLLAHELAHVALAHGGVRRGGYGDAMIAAYAEEQQRKWRPKQTYAAWKAATFPAKPEPPAPAAPVGACTPPSTPQPQRPIFVDGTQIVDDEEFMYCQLRQRVATKGITEPEDVFFPLLQADYAKARDYAHVYGTGGPPSIDAPPPLSVDELYAESHVIDLMPGMLFSLYQEQSHFIVDFEEKAKQLAEEVLARSEQQERAEAFRYGIDWQTIKTQIADCLFGDCTRDETLYSMRPEPSAAATELQAAAKILLDRRKDIDDAKTALDTTWEAYADAVNEGRVIATALAYNVHNAEKTYQDKIDKYELTRGYLGKSYPILGAFSDREHSASDLEKLSKQKTGPEMAALLGEQIVERLSNIAKVRKGLKSRDEVNIFRLPLLIGITERAMGVDADATKKVWLDEQVKAEKPSLLESIALGVFNIVALLLAGPTGGLSLALAAGVNAVVAMQHVKDYMLQKALTGTAFDKAQALSQDEPSLFWLAVEIVGVGLDAAAAFKAISTAVKTVELAKEAKDVARTAEEIKKLEDAVRHAGGDEGLVRRIVAHVGGEAGEERAALTALGVTEAEAKTLRGGAELAEKELQAGTASGRAAVGSARVSRAGHIFSCSWPCTWMREKYADLLGSEIHVGGDATSLRQQYLALEADAAKTAEQVSLAEGKLKLAQPSERAAAAEELARAQDAAAAIEKNVADFDHKLAKEVSYRNAVEKLKQLDPDEASRLVHLKPEGVVRIAQLDADAAKALLRLPPDVFFKITELGETELRILARFDPSALAVFAKLDAETLTYVAHVGHLNPAAVEWLSKLSAESVRKLATAQITSRFSLRQLMEKIGPASSAKQFEKALARAQRHKSQLRRAVEAAESGDWSKIPGKERTSIGKHIGYELEELTRTIASGGRAKAVLNYEHVNAQLIAKLEKDGGRVVITQGRLKGGDLRFDLAEIDFDHKTVELIDLAPKGDPAHVAGTKLYEAEMQKLLPDFKITSMEQHYVGAEDQVLEVLEEVGVKP